MTAVLVGAAECPVCHAAIGPELEPLRDVTRKKPREGDLSLCLNCGAILVFQMDLTLRRSVGSDFAEAETIDLMSLMAWRDLIVRRGPLPGSLS
jgi:hypothetical protein